LSPVQRVDPESTARFKLPRHIEASLRLALAGLTGSEFTVVAQEKVSAEGFDEAFIWQQCFSIVDGPALWLVAGRDLWESLGRLTLESAGVDTVSDEDCRSTWQEINGQTIGGMAAEMTSDIVREIATTHGEELSAEPADAVWFGFQVTGADGRSWPFKAAWSQGLAELYEPPPRETRGAAGRETTVSKTFDLLLEVALPVSVSFGKTSLQIREVLKLNTGSIVELNRLVTDPVEVIVNDCVIARGEVVVVDGNYGVRINQLVSREDRLKTGMAGQSRIGVRP
jgi:flagellar motor switch protein FliN/FliY